MRANIVKPLVTQLEVDARSGLIESVASREVTAMDDQIIADGLLLTRAFFKIADAADRQKVIQLALSLARPGPKDAGAGASPPIASR